MKILELRFKNLNSLYGEWRIDFTAPQYISDGIFALTGPTGAGKSTILDAVCLALYGTTPRLGRITKSSNEIMSRQTHDCFAEVVFESQAGKYRCFWGQHRAHKKADGNLIDAKHEISDAETGKLIESKKSLVINVIEAKTGMDFDRFTRSILLAQGGFDTFLKADTEQKSKILEQITGTEIYSEISRRVHERYRDEKEKLNLLEAETAGIVILDEEAEKTIQKDMDTKQTTEKKQQARLAEITATLNWLTQLENLKKEMLSLDSESANLNSKIEAFKPDRERLLIANRAANLDATFATLNASRKQTQSDKSQLATEQQKLPEIEANGKRQAEKLETAKSATLKAKDAQINTMPIITKTRALDQRITELTKSKRETDTTINTATKKLATDSAAKDDNLNRRNTLVEQLGKTQQYLEANARDEWLISGIEGLEDRLSTLEKQKDKLSRLSQELNTSRENSGKLEKILQKASKDRQAKQNSLSELAEKQEKQKEQLSKLLDGQLLREYRAQKDALLRELVHINRIIELEDHRGKLEDGTECPLCGSLDHPFAKGNTPQPDETEKKIETLNTIIEDAERLEATIANLEKKKSGASEAVTAAEKTEANAKNEVDSLQKSIETLGQGVEESTKDYDAMQADITGRLTALGFTESSELGLTDIKHALRERLSLWQKHVAGKADQERALSTVDSEIQRQEALIQAQTELLEEKQEQVRRLQLDLKEIQAEREQLFGTKSPDAEEKRLHASLLEAEEAEASTRQTHEALRDKWQATKTNIQALILRLSNAEKELSELEDSFKNELRLHDFETEPQFIQSRLAPRERESLTKTAGDLDTARTDLTARQKDRQTRLNEESAKKLTDQSLADIDQQFKEAEGTLSQLRDEIAAMKNRLLENLAAKERLKEKRAIIETRKKEFSRWEKLHSLIGSADGKKYRGFAQGLTFELMVSHANQQLEKMTDRYLLIHDETRPLELNVVDNYQAGEIRSTRNLSGGESFIVSLTLALGLSKMASRKVRVDSLFLDEGFGTLDEDALESALETLSRLHQDGKLIGIISHVPALKERIATQINVSPLSGGKSAISGPGCQKVLGK